MDSSLFRITVGGRNARLASTEDVVQVLSCRIVSYRGMSSHVLSLSCLVLSYSILSYLIQEYLKKSKMKYNPESRQYEKVGDAGSLRMCPVFHWSATVVVVVVVVVVAVAAVVVVVVVVVVVLVVSSSYFNSGRCVCACACVCGQTCGSSGTATTTKAGSCSVTIAGPEDRALAAKAVVQELLSKQDSSFTLRLPAPHVTRLEEMKLNLHKLAKATGMTALDVNTQVPHEMHPFGVCVCVCVCVCVYPVSVSVCLVSCVYFDPLRTLSVSHECWS
jgi:hypothetical protein